MASSNVTFLRSDESGGGAYLLSALKWAIIFWTTRSLIFSAYTANQQWGCIKITWVPFIINFYYIVLLFLHFQLFLQNEAHLLILYTGPVADSCLWEWQVGASEGVSTFFGLKWPNLWYYRSSSAPPLPRCSRARMYVILKWYYIYLAFSYILQMHRIRSVYKRIFDMAG